MSEDIEVGDVVLARVGPTEHELQPVSDQAVIARPDLAERLREQFTPEERIGLIAALLAEQKAEIERQKTTAPAPDIERINNANFVVNADPAMKGALDDPQPAAPPEPGDTPEERARLLAILFANPSGVPGTTLLDQYHIPPETIDLARRHGQAGWAERGIGLTGPYGGPWSPDTKNVVGAEEMKRYQEMFAQRMAARATNE